MRACIVSHLQRTRKTLECSPSDSGEGELAESVDPSNGLQSRRKRRKRRQESKAADRTSTSRFGLVLFGIMCLALLVYSSLTLLQLQVAARSIGPYALGMSQADIRYQFGNPQGSGPDPNVWNYVNAGSRIRLGFGPDRRLALVTCFQEEVYEGPCPQKLGVGIGSAESDVTRLLGPPDTAGYDREDKVVQYRGLGLKARFRKLRVVEIEHSPASGWAGMVRAALWRMLP